MLDDHLLGQRQRQKKRFNFSELIGPVICGVAVIYLLTAALLGLLAR